MERVLLSYLVVLALAFGGAKALAVVGPASRDIGHDPLFSGVGQIISFHTRKPGCGTALIDDRILVTARHCVEVDQPYKVVFTTSRNPSLEFEVLKVIKPTYELTPDGLINAADIAILILKRSPSDEIGVRIYKLTSLKASEIGEALIKNQHFLVGYMNEKDREAIYGPLRGGSSIFESVKTSHKPELGMSAPMLNFASNLSWHVAGDSGNPLFLILPDRLEIIGVTSAEGRPLAAGGKTSHYVFISKSQSWTQAAIKMAKNLRRR